MDGLAEWASSAGATVGVDAGEADVAEILELARDVQRAVAKPAAIVAVYLFGVAVGRGSAGGEAVGQLADLAKQWPGTTCDWCD